MRTSLFKLVAIATLIAWSTHVSQTVLAKPRLRSGNSGKQSAVTSVPVKRWYDVEKSKKISKVFKVSASDKLEIDNKFGKVHVNTWDKNEITVEVIIIARANNDERAQDILDKIDVKIDQGSNLISFKTEMSSIKGNNKQGFEINYTVSMPKGNPLRLKNSFGDTYLANYNGRGDLDIGYGNLKAEQLLGNENTIKIAFGSGNIAALKNSKLNISYSKLTLGSGEVLDLKNEFSDIRIERVRDLSIQSKYGDVRLGTVNTLQGYTGFSGFRIGELNDQLDMKVQYCGDFEVEKIARDFKSINLDGGFSTFDLNFVSAAAFNFDVDLDFGNLRLDNEQVDYSLKEKKNTSSHHIGKVGKGSGANVKVKAQYGDVKIDRAD